MITVETPSIYHSNLGRIVENEVEFYRTYGWIHEFAGSGFEVISSLRQLKLAG